MNTSRAGSNRPCSRFQRRRARATSARSCSAARKLFFEGDLIALKKPPHRCPATGNLMLAHRADQLVQCQVRLHLDQRQQKVRVFFQRRCAPTTRFGGTLAGLAKALHPDHRRAGAHFVLFRCLRREAPLSTCPITRWRISAEYAFAIDRLPKSNQCRKTHAPIIAQGESPRFNQAEHAVSLMRVSSQCFLLIASNHGRFLYDFFIRTPAPPPFSSMDSMPADSKARTSAAVVGA